MKKINQYPALIVLILLGSLSACEQNVTVQSDVHEDGSVNRTVIFSYDDSSKIEKNFFGIKPEKGWKVNFNPGKPDSADNKNPSQQDGIAVPKKSSIVSFSKTFNSVEEANAEMNADGDTLFKIRSDFEKKFRWFYTYIKYSDTYISANRFKNFPSEDYLAKEDFAFIDRIPANGKLLSKADSLFGEKLSEKIFEELLYKAIFDEHYDGMLKVLADDQYDQRWIDTLKVKKVKILNDFLKEKDSYKDDKDFMMVLMKQYNLPPPSDKAIESYHIMVSDLEKRMDFMGLIPSATFVHSIKMPWKIVSSNADSISGSQLYWKPYYMKYLVRDYTMYAEARSINYWAVIISVAIIILTIFAFVRKKRRVINNPA